ncbi:hypothetical protein BC826DRAFT_101150 [Russula brevipes]|nr:hypothetical protein BC826DRAFT_101150 [Russula brevipes]
MGSQNRHTRKSVQSPANIVAQTALPIATSTDGPWKNRLRHRQKQSYRQAYRSRGLRPAMIDKLPDDALLEIFDFYLDYNIDGPHQDFDKWHTLVHVCQRWRNVVFASPCRLDLRLLCRKDRPVRAMPDIWPALPISIDIEDFLSPRWETRLDNFMVALEHPDRVRSISLTDVPGIRGEPLIAAIQVRFPELTEMRVWVCEPPIRDSFLGGCAPRLRTLWLRNVRFRQHRPYFCLPATSLTLDLTVFPIRCTSHPRR